MCFERLLQAFARWQLDILFDIGAKPILECWIDSYTQPSHKENTKLYETNICEQHMQNSVERNHRTYDSC